MPISQYDLNNPDLSGDIIVPAGSKVATLQPTANVTSVVRSITSTIVTTPAASASVATGYGANTASVATVVQNTLGYDALFVGYFQGAASVVTFQIGTGSTATPAMTTVATGITNAAVQTWDFPAYVPSNYYYSFQASQANGAASVPSSAFVIVAHPA
jgi:hypothetical protein